MRILVTGGNGLVGSSLKRLTFGWYPTHEIVFVGSKDFDLTNENHVKNMFEVIKPDAVIHTAARVGGIGRNLNSPAEQFHENILMNTHVIHHAWKSGVKKLIAFSSVCAFPKDAACIIEENMHEGMPFPAHGAYAYAKRMVDVQIEAYSKQYGVNYCSLIPGNIFGENDNYSLEDGHVVPSLIHKCFLAKKNETKLDVWGDGTPTREFIYVDDLSRICLKLLLSSQEMPKRLIVSGQEMRISKLVDVICNAMNYSSNNVNWLTDKPNGQLKRETSHTLFDSLFPDSMQTSIEEGIKKSCAWFEKNYPNVRF